MGTIRLLVWLCPLVLWLIAPAAAQQGDRVALVIGNAAYPDARAPLPNAVNDVDAMAAEFRRLRFAVTLKKNLHREELRDAVDTFTGNIKKGATALFYFSGFGVQVRRQTYLLPVNASIWTESDVRRDGVSVDALLGDMHRKGAKVKIIIIDAARRNPFERRFRSVAEGLAPLNAPVDTLVLYSGALNRVIDERSAGGHSMFAAELLKELRAPDQTVEDVFNRVRIGVSRASSGRQVPWVASSLLGEVYFGDRPAGASVSAAPDSTRTPVASTAPEPPPPAAAPPVKRPAKQPEKPVAPTAPAPPPKQIAALDKQAITPARMSVNVKLGVIPGSKRGMLGVRVAGLNDELAKTLGLTSAHGAFVSNVAPNGPAGKAGIAPTDVVVSFDGRNVGDWIDLPIIVGGTPPGSNARVVLWRLADNPKDLADKLKRRADGGSDSAAYTLAWLYITETQLLKDDAQAVRWARRAADDGHVEAAYLLGQLYLNGRGVEKNETKAADLFRKAALKDSTNAMHALAGLYTEGRGVNKDAAEALRWYHKAAEGGNVLAMSALGQLYLNGKVIAKDTSKAAIWFRRAADHNNPLAMANLGWLYESGQGVSQDYAQAARWYRKAADLHQSGAMYRLGVLAEAGNGRSKDEVEAASWFRKAADLGHSSAMVALGLLYESGRGVGQDTAEALRLFAKAAKAGNAAGDFYAGAHYERAKEYKKAVPFYAAAARKGHPTAMHNLGVAYDKGIGVPQNRRLAAQWVIKAIRSGSAFSVKQMLDNSNGYSVQFRRQFQRQMADAGVYDGAIDGRFGAGTREAIKLLVRRAGQQQR
jgi:TPR repeat protein